MKLYVLNLFLPYFRTRKNLIKENDTGYGICYVLKGVYIYITATQTCTLGRNKKLEVGR